uniref:telomere repeats-binding bouquet formation protein 1-like isoform X2 n=1 Tax=Styela clava TaxID=7725 RepID=UPI00193A5251|nr:telomere repeats-binding bouquet formation protein 1-like isoform X2 [Styela clava]
MNGSGTSLTDIKILLDFLKQDVSASGSEQAQITSLQALSSMCSKEVSELIMQCGGLNIMWKLCGTTKCPEVCQSCLYTLACVSESNVHVKHALSTKGVFGSIKSILEESDIPDRTRLFAIYFLIPLVTGNEFGQNLIKSSGCLQTLLSIFVSGVQLITCGKLLKQNCQREVWMLSAKVLRLCVGSPQNKTNQMSCIEYIPHIITIIHEAKGDEEIVLHACQFFAAVVENNQRCKKKSFSCRALEVLVLAIQSCSNEKLDKVSGEIVICLNNFLEDSKEYCERFGKLGGIGILLRIVDSDNIHLTSRHRSLLLMILKSCAENSEAAQRKLIEYNAASTIVHLMNTVQDDEHFNKIAASVLNYCMRDLKDVPDRYEKEVNDSDEADDTSSTKSSTDHECAKKDTNNKYGFLNPGKTQVDRECFDLVNGGGSCISEVIEKQQTQIDLLNKLLLQERDKRIENEKTLSAIVNSNAMSVCGSTILSPPGSCFRSYHLPLQSMSVRRCRSRSWSIASAPIKKQSKRFQDTFDREKTRSFSRGSKLLYNKQHSRNYDKFQNLQDNISVKQTEDQGSQIDMGIIQHIPESPDGSIIDIESYTPKKPKKIFKEKGAMTKYYVKENDKISQHVSGSKTSSIHQRSNSEGLQMIKEKRLNKSPEADDNLMSVCSEILKEEIKKAKRRVRSQSCSSMKSSPRVLRSRKIDKEVQCSEEDVYSYKDSPTDFDFKKPMLPPQKLNSKRSRPRKRFDYQERKNLEEGVKRLGTNFKEILFTYEFHPCRTAMDLRDKYRNLMKNNI